MTEPLYLDRSTVHTFSATVERVIEDSSAARVVLDRTHFYPTGGGQPHDTGKLTVDDRAWSVDSVTKRDTIYHHVPGDDPPAPGVTVEGVLDWGRRFSLMRYHTAQHVLSAILLEKFDAKTVGNQLYPDRARIDSAYDRYSTEDLQMISDRVNAIIDQAHPIRWYEMDRNRASDELDPERTRLDLLPDSISTVRIVEIEEVDRTACAGTHLRNTRDIGRFEITGRETAGKGKERIHFVLTNE